MCEATLKSYKNLLELVKEGGIDEAAAKPVLDVWAKMKEDGLALVGELEVFLAAWGVHCKTPVGFGDAPNIKTHEEWLSDVESARTAGAAGADAFGMTAELLDAAVVEAKLVQKYWFAATDYRNGRELLLGDGCASGFGVTVLFLLFMFVISNSIQTTRH